MLKRCLQKNLLFIQPQIMLLNCNNCEMFDWYLRNIKRILIVFFYYYFKQQIQPTSHVDDISTNTFTYTVSI